jgi:hypothetical protein
VKEAVIDASGACKLNGNDLNIDVLKASSSGASNIRVNVLKEISADASGGSTLYYKGSATVKNINATAGASIKNRSGNDD